MSVSHGSPKVFRNDQSLNNHWVKIQLVGKSSNRDAIGATIELKHGDQYDARTLMPTKSYLSQCEKSCHLWAWQRDGRFSVVHCELAGR